MSAVPDQGSVIAPLLFNIMVHNVDTAAKGKVVLIMYADDLANGWTPTSDVSAQPARL